MAHDQKTRRTRASSIFFAAQARLMCSVLAVLSLEGTVVLALALSTAALAYTIQRLLGLPLPSANLAKIPTPATGEKVKTALVWGGSSSVGSAAIQLVRASGARAITTVLPRNHDAVRALGAEHAYDYHSKTIISDLVEALKDTNLLSVCDAISLNASTEAVVAILDGLDKKLPVANVRSQDGAVSATV